jgi:hypothetical protein
MARFHAIWHVNPSAPWPTDPSKNLEMLEMMWAGIEGMMKKGEIEEWGIFPDGGFGYTISKGETVDVFRRANMFYPFVIFEVHEIIPYEKQKEIIRANTKAQIAAMKKK